MLKRKRAADEAKQQGNGAAAAASAAAVALSAAAAAPSGAAEGRESKIARKEASRDVSRYINKQRTLVLSSRGITHRDRHLLSDLRDLMPHSKKDAKFDAKDDLGTINELCEMKNCSNAVFFEARKRKDLYMWVSRAPNGPSVKFHVQNIHTMAEVKMTGNCLKGSRAILNFDSTFDTTPSYKLLKELLTQTFGAPKGHPKVKPFIDHMFSFFIADNRIWFRNYQIVYDLVDPDAAAATGSNPAKQAAEKPVLVEIGPRFVLNPIKIFGGSFGGATLWENPAYVSPNTLRAAALAARANKYDNRTKQIAATQQHRAESIIPSNPIDTVFED